MTQCPVNYRHDYRKVNSDSLTIKAPKLTAHYQLLITLHHPKEPLRERHVLADLLLQGLH
jgi:hypothetical protein